MRSFMLGVLASGALFGFLCLFGGILGWSSLKKKEADVRRGWNLVPVVVAAVDISENTELTFDLISQRSVPEQFVTSSVVKPDAVIRIVGHKLLVPVKAGDMMLWTEVGLTPASAQH